MTVLDYYVDQSPITHPGEMVGHLATLPHEVAALQRVARGLVLHYRADDPSAHGIPHDRLAEIDSRYAEIMLQRLIELDRRPLTEERPPQRRLLGCCRDDTVLVLTMTRHVGVPARARVGFATYFVPDFNLDHEVAEVWDADEARWRLVDPELGDDHVDPTDGARWTRWTYPGTASSLPGWHGRHAAGARQTPRGSSSIQGSRSGIWRQEAEKTAGPHHEPGHCHRRSAAPFIHAGQGAPSLSAGGRASARYAPPR